MNICKNCDIKFFIAANNGEACKNNGGGAHVVKYDFEKS